MTEPLVEALTVPQAPALAADGAVHSKSTSVLPRVRSASWMNSHAGQEEHFSGRIAVGTRRASRWSGDDRDGFAAGSVARIGKWPCAGFVRSHSVNGGGPMDGVDARVVSLGTQGWGPPHCA